ncbi:uncharacterized protein RBU57_014714 [Macrochelys suwanniensis]
MATESPVGKLEDEVTCSICLEFFEDPVSIHCGHNFCRACINQCWEALNTNFSCPQCRETAPQRNCKANRELGHIAEIAKQLSLRVGAGEEERVCDLYGEDLKFFCEEDQKLIGLIYRDRQAHKSQPVGPTPEAAARNYKRAIQTHMKALKKESMLLLESKLTEERKSKEALEKTDAERQKIVAEFEQLRQFLEEQQWLLLAWLEELDKEIVKRQNANGAKFSADISFVYDLIDETEKCQQQTANFPQDFISISNRWDKWKTQEPVEISSGMEKGIHIFMKKYTILKKTLQKFKGAMAAESPVESLRDELSCPICLEYFQEPVSIHCGHNFCLACISHCWGASELNFSCPQCRETAQQRNFRPSRELARVIEIARELSVQAAKGSGGERVCERHQEALKLFCEEDQTPICVVCDRSKAHRAHTVVPVEEAAQEYKEQFQTRLQALKEEREKLLGWKLTGEKRSSEYMGKTDTEREKIVSQFKQLHQFLEEEERLQLDRLGELDKEIVKLQDENITKLSAEISRLSELISEMEGKCQQPASEFLQDVRNALSRCEQGKFQQPVEISPDLAKRLGDFTQKNIVLKETLKKLQDALRFELQTATNVTLDPDVAHPQLILSADRKSVRWEKIRQQVPKNPERFDTTPCVLGCAFTQWIRIFQAGRDKHLERAMSAESPAESLRDELSCPICLEYFTDPVTIECGHNFCRACISQCWGEPEPNFSCPQCRETAPQRNLRPNRQLGNVVELVKRLRLPAVTEPEGERVCERHQEALKLFCEEDQTPICVVCDRSKAHRAHTVVPVEEAAQEYKEQFQTRLQALKEEKKKLQGWKLSGEKRSSEYLGKTDTEREKIVSQFKQLHQFLEEEERFLLARLGELEKEIVKLQDENITKLSMEISRLSELISEMEGKCQQPASEFLQDVRNTLSRCEQGKFQQPVEISPDLAKRLGDFTQKNIVLKETLRKFQGIELRFKKEKESDLSECWRNLAVSN